MAANIKTIRTIAETKAAKDIRTISTIKTSVESKFDAAKKALLDLVMPDFEESFGVGGDTVTNFKIHTGEVVELGVDENGEEQFEVKEDGGLVQVVMKISTTELDPVKASELEGYLGSVTFKKLFKEVEEITDIQDYPAFLEAVATDPKLDKNFSLGKTGISIKVKDVSHYKKVNGVFTGTKIVNSSSFLSKINDLDPSTAPEAVTIIREFVEEAISPAVQVGNRTEEASN
jgi:hypothetical protein